MRVTLIITTYNWPEALHLCLKSVAGQTRIPDEIVIADDGSGAATADTISHWAGRLPCEVKHVWQEDLGFRVARSRNGALAASTGDYVVLIDGDMLVERHFVADHVRCARPDCFIQGARAELSPEATAQLLQTQDVPPTAFTKGVSRRPYACRSPLMSSFASKAKTTLAGIQGCNQSFWREHAVRVNGYDERFTAWGPEDREFAARLLHIGLKRNYVRHLAIAFHLYHRTRAPSGVNPLDELLVETLAHHSTRSAMGLDRHLARPTEKTG